MTFGNLAAAYGGGGAVCSRLLKTRPHSTILGRLTTQLLILLLPTSSPLSSKRPQPQWKAGKKGAATRKHHPKTQKIRRWKLSCAVEVAATIRKNCQFSSFCRGWNISVVFKHQVLRSRRRSNLWIQVTLEFETPHPHLIGGVANYGIKLWGTNAAFFMPQGGVHAAPPPPPPSAAAPPGVHAQVAQNGTVYYHQPPVRQNKKQLTTPIYHSSTRVLVRIHSFTSSSTLLIFFLRISK